MFEILKRQEMADGTVVLNEISAPLIAKKAKPGQFVILKANETGERIPLTMAEADPKKGIITIIYQIVGKTTALFKSLQVGDKFQDVIGGLMFDWHGPADMKGERSVRIASKCFSEWAVLHQGPDQLPVALDSLPANDPRWLKKVDC